MLCLKNGFKLFYEKLVVSQVAGKWGTLSLSAHYYLIEAGKPSASIFVGSLLIVWFHHHLLLAPSYWTRENYLFCCHSFRQKLSVSCGAFDSSVLYVLKIVIFFLLLFFLRFFLINSKLLKKTICDNICDNNIEWYGDWRLKLSERYTNRKIYKQLRVYGLIENFQGNTKLNKKDFILYLRLRLKETALICEGAIWKSYSMISPERAWHIFIFIYRPFRACWGRIAILICVTFLYCTRSVIWLFFCSKIMVLIIVSDTELTQTPWNFVGMMVKVLSFPSLLGSAF